MKAPTTVFQRPDRNVQSPFHICFRPLPKVLQSPVIVPLKNPMTVLKTPTMMSQTPTKMSFRPVKTSATPSMASTSAPRNRPAMN